VADYTNMDALVRDLKFRAKPQSSEGWIDPDDFQAIVSDSTLRHNKDYVCTTVECTIPILEHLPVVVLSWADLTSLRANRWAQDPNVTGVQGFGTDRNTPYYKLTDLVEKLHHNYLTICEGLGLEVYAPVKPPTESGSTPISGPPILTEVVSENYDILAQTPVELSHIPPGVKLYSDPTAAIGSDGSVILTWESDRYQNFAYFHICYLSGSTPIYLPWNFNSKSGVPRTNDNTTVLSRIGDNRIRSLKVTDIDPNVPEIHRFLIANQSKSDRWTYSNEIMLTGAIPLSDSIPRVDSSGSALEASRLTDSGVGPISVSAGLDGSGNAVLNVSVNGGNTSP